MRPTTLPFALLFGISVAQPSAVHADFTARLPSCSWGAFLSCHSVQISTVFVFGQDGTITGTAVRIAITNLQGSGQPAAPGWFPPSATPDVQTSVLSALTLRWAIATGVTINSFAIPVSTSLIGGAVGQPGPGTWLSLQPYDPTTPTGMAVLDFTGFHIGGCTVAALATAYTCARWGLDPAVLLSFTVPFQLDLIPNAAGEGGIDDMFTSEFACFEGQTYNAFGSFGSETHQEASGGTDVCPSGDPVVITPEPLTVLLLATGLFGVGGGLLRRKNLWRGD